MESIWDLFVLFRQPFSKSEGFPGGSDGKEFTCNAGDPGSMPRLGRSSGEGHGNPVFLPGNPHGQRSLVNYSP